MAITTTAVLIAALAASAIGAGVSAYSSVQQGKAQQALAEKNAAIDDQAAADASRDAAAKANEVRAQNEKLKARQRALYSSAGVVAATGSPLLVQVEQAGELELGALDTERTGEVQAAQLRQQAVIDRMGGASARSAGNLNAAATIIQGVGSAANTYSRYQGVK